MNRKKGKPDLIARPLKKTFKDSCNDTWDSYFMDKIVNNNQLSELLNAVEYLDINYLGTDCFMSMIGAYIALKLQNTKSMEEMKDILTATEKQYYN